MSEQNHEPETNRGAVISEHPHPRPALRRITGWIVALGLIGDVFGVVGLFGLGIALGLPLLPLMALTLATFLVPLLLLTVLHPAITVYEGGLWIEPLLWHGTWVPWDAVTRVEDHTLMRRGKEKDRQKEHFGQLIVVDGALPRVYTIVGIMAGLGWVRAFGISTHSHTDYKAILNAIQRHKRRK